MNPGRLVFPLALFFLIDVCGYAQTQSQPSPPPAAAPAPVLDEQTEKDRRYAIELYQQGKLLEALPWFEKVLAKAPSDAGMHEGLGASLLAKASTQSDAAQRKTTRIQARQEFLKAQELGDHSDYLQVELASLLEDGRDPVFSNNAEVDRLMKEGEAAFGANKLDDAKNSYLAVLLLDPNNYDALLFLGDVYFRKGDAPAAGEWFARAIQVDPTQETAYRYWGDALLKSGKTAAAREKYIDGALCNPYEQRSWAGINRYVSTTKQTVTWYKIKPATSFSTDSKANVTINVDPNSMDSKDGSSAWLVYPMERVQWKKEKFAKEYPSEKQYRHSLKEESSALSLVASVASELSSGKKAEKLNPDLQALVSLKNAGFLDAYVLINVPDQGIAQDYEEYRKAHRDVLVRYLNEAVVPAAPSEPDTH